MTDFAPWPIPDAVTQPFWDACKAGRFTLQYCTDCRSWQFYPRIVCVACMSSKLEWREASGKATVHSLTITPRAAAPAFADRVPLIVALVDLDEGPRMLTNITGCEPGEVSIGDRVLVDLFEVDDSVVLPMFTKSPDEAQEKRTE